MKTKYQILIIAVLILSFGFSCYMVGLTTPHKAIHITDRERVDVVERSRYKFIETWTYGDGWKHVWMRYGYETKQYTYYK